MSTQEAKQIAARMIALGLAKVVDAKPAKRASNGDYKRNRRAQFVAMGLTHDGKPRKRSWVKSGLSRKEYMKQYHATHPRKS